MSGVGVHNSGYRRFNRSFGRGNPSPFQPYQRHPSPQRARRGGDLFVEAGRLAVEYLVANGLLSSNVLSDDFQNGTLRNNSGSQDRDMPCSRVDSPQISITHQRADFLDGVSGRRWSPNDQDHNNYSRERRRYWVSRNDGSECSQGNDKEGSMSDKVTASERMEANNEKSSMDASKDADIDVCDSCPSESAPKDNGNRQLQNEMENCYPRDDADSKVNCLPENEDVEELPKPLVGVDAGSDGGKDDSSDDDIVNKTSSGEKIAEHVEENSDRLKKDGSDMLRPSPSAETATTADTLSSSPTSDPAKLPDGNNASDTGADPVKSTEDVAVNSSSEIPSSNENKPEESPSFTDCTFSSEQTSIRLPQLGSFSSIAEDRCKKRLFEDQNTGEGDKRAKQWLSVAQSDEFSQLSDLSENHSISRSNVTTPMSIFNQCGNPDSFTNVSLPLKGSAESTMEQGEEKQLFSNSFKICDLNVMGASDIHENHNMSRFSYPSISASNKNANVNVDLSMNNNNYSLTCGYNDRGDARKDIEIIDLEGTSLQEDRSMDTSTRNMEGDIANMDSFSNNPQNCTNNPDSHDGYGLMISELLGNDVPNCSSVQPDINPLHSDMDLHHGEGIFSEDDPIYMTLGEFPLSILRGWEQPTQERNPFGL